MARPRIYTHEQRAAKEREWMAASNETRRNQYRKEPAYRDKTMKAAREHYRENSAQDVKGCAENLDKLDTMGTVRRVQLGAQCVNIVSFTIDELAIAIGGYHPVVVRRWIRDGMFPEPAFREQKEIPQRGAKAHVYTLNQVRAFVTAFAEQQKEKQNFYATDREFIATLFTAASRI